MNRVYLLLVVAALFGIGSALKCYECNDKTWRTCTNFVANATYEANCTDTDKACGKIVTRVKGSFNVLVERLCVAVDKKPKGCDTEDDTAIVSCYMCKGDLCNTAAIPSSVSSLVYILPIALFLFTGSPK